MKKLLLLVITCAVSAGFIRAADDQAPPAAPATQPLHEQLLKNDWVQAGLWIGGAVLAYDVLNQVTGIGCGTINVTAEFASLKKALYNFQQSLPASVVANPKASALAFAVAVTAGTRYGFSWPRDGFGTAAQAAAVYAVAYWLLTHKMAAPVDEATALDTTTTTTA